jgi:hypothetical protein
MAVAAEPSRLPSARMLNPSRPSLSSRSIAALTIFSRVSVSRGMAPP